MSNSFKYTRLSKDNGTCLLIDHQSGLISLVQDFSQGEFKNNVLALAASAQYFKLPFAQRHRAAGVISTKRYPGGASFPRHADRSSSVCAFNLGSRASSLSGGCWPPASVEITGGHRKDASSKTILLSPAQSPRCPGR